MEIVQLINHIKMVQKATKEAKHVYRDRFAPDFTMFDFIEPNEMRLSRILAWFLDPEGTHGQGGRFLHLLLKRLAAGWSLDACEHAKVGTEISVEEGRMDITVHSPSGILVIENKPWATDQPSQIRRYFTYLDRMKENFSQPKASCFILIYLTAQGTAPSNISICQNEQQRRIEYSQLCYWSYREHILGWLAECRVVCRADRVSIFISEFIQYVRKHFEGIADMTIQNQIVDILTQSTETLSPTMEIIFAKNAIFTKLISNLNDAIYDKAETKKWGINGKISGGKDSFLTIDSLHNSCCVFDIGFECPDFKGFYYGVVKRNKNQPSDEGVRAMLVKSIGKGKSTETDGWPWYRYGSMGDDIMPFEADWNFTEKPWIAIADGSMVEIITKAVGRFHNILSCHSLT